MGDGFLVLCPPGPPEVISEALSCQAFIDAYNVGKEQPLTLSTRIAIHYGLIAPPERSNYIDTNLNLTARLEGATPPNCICISSTLYDIVADTLRELTFQELETTFKGLGESKYYVVIGPAGRTSERSRRESRLSFYFSTLATVRKSADWEALKTTCEQALLDFPGNPEFTSQLGFALLVLGDYPGAIRSMEQCVAKDYAVGRSLLYIGRAYDRMGNQTRAIEILTEVTEKDPTPFHALADIADIYLRRRDYGEALKWAKKSLKVNRKFLTPMATLIAIYMIKREDDAGVRVIKKVRVDRRDLLRSLVERRLKEFKQKPFPRRLSAMFLAAAKKG